jgi:hypothetical protein|tara:strand:- start:554 stop:736 length:183 start_codon:yes stop_codon:yes gene_type:complete
MSCKGLTGRSLKQCQESRAYELKLKKSDSIFNAKMKVIDRKVAALKLAEKKKKSLIKKKK